MAAPMLSCFVWGLPITKKSSFESPVKRFGRAAQSHEFHGVPVEGPGQARDEAKQQITVRLAKHGELWPLSAELR
jgi:hypothetical protein